MKILIFNWRDIKNPSSGGAEILTHEIAKRWAAQEHSVTQFSSEFPGCLSEELIDRILIIRKGHPDARYLFRSVHFQAFWHYIKYFHGKFDVVIDEIHGLPFFTPLYVREKKIALICEVAGNLWYKMYGHIFGQIGRLAEITYLRYFYQRMHFLAISESTKKELINNGIKKHNIDVIPMGVKVPSYKKSPHKENGKTLILVGRLSKQKGTEDAIQVLEEVLKFFPSGKLWIVGRGEEAYTKYLKEITHKKKLDEKITFFGYISDDEKFNLMSRAHLLLVPSTKEGFGLTIPEAGFVGTPAVAYNVAGVRDIIKDGENGILVDPNPHSMSMEVVRILSNKDDFNVFKKNIKKFYNFYDFDKSARKTLNLIRRYAYK